ncbi:dorsal-ventral patterning tolloid-like protein 1 [Acanthaster planci]|uniref:Metalloendopeptidase n=1 Tax=Acanthaster planci TaxID=133434 RepID=A0A8B7XNJ1_ACAPL|nr:dorsal-ventral patterning tolloid-like protein 1 [Acanthaster planci]
MKPMLLVMLAGFVVVVANDRMRRNEFAATSSVQGVLEGTYSESVVESQAREDTRAARMEAAPSPNSVEGDMIMTLEQEEEYMVVQEATAENKTRIRRSGATAFKGWPNGTLVYTYAADVSSHTKLLFEKAIKKYKEKTGIQFVEAHDGSYVGTIQPLTVRQRGAGCYATLGCVGVNCGGFINLQKYACEVIGVMLHEIGHALGRFHEHTRSDRDNHIFVIRSNIRPGFEKNFEKRQWPIVAPYDSHSVMHYAALAYSRDGVSETIFPYNARDRLKMGRQSELTRLDAYSINAAYNLFECSSPENVWKRCRRGGVPNKHCTCDCLPTFSGPYCETFEKPTDCSQIHTRRSGTITSPGFPRRYPNNAHCTYVIECSEKSLVELRFKNFRLEAGNCWYDTLSIFMGVLESETYPDVYCGNFLQGQLLVSFDNVVIMDFKSDSGIRFPGFEVKYRCVPTYY